MSKASKRKSKKSKSSPDSPTLPVNMEKTMSDLHKLLEQQQFDSIEEANAFLQSMLNSGQPLPTSYPATPLEQAQEIMYDAWDTASKTKRIKLAYQALEISLDCADAYVLLAEDSAKSVFEAHALYVQGVLAGQRAIGQEFEGYVGHFWGITETRPYMRARAGVAECLWFMGQKQEAIEHYQAMLTLNPNDNQGIRYLLLPCLLTIQDEKATTKLFEQYESDVSASWLYNYALFCFQQSGVSADAAQALKKAFDRNPHVPDYLSGKKKPPKSLPPYIQLGGASEAASYFVGSGHLWQDNPEALAWLKGEVG